MHLFEDHEEAFIVDLPSPQTFCQEIVFWKTMWNNSQVTQQ